MRTGGAGSAPGELPFANMFANVAAFMAGMGASSTYPPAPPQMAKVSQGSIAPENVEIRCTYPEIPAFFDHLTKEYPQRILIGIAELLTGQDFFCIDELEDETEEFFKGGPYYMTAGNAKFLIKKIKEGVEKARRVATD
jgi:hypothetical protein